MSYQDKILRLEDVIEHFSLLREQGQKIVFTNGCFDILHKGHITYLEKARALGDLLIVGLNSDASVKRLKGADRPIKKFESRVAVLAGLASIDFVVIFEEDTPLNLIELVKPDVLVKGGDYKVEDIVGADFVLNNGGAVKTIEFVSGFSSTSIIQKMESDLKNE